MAEREQPISQQVPSLEKLQRLGKNINGYFGETIDIATVLTDCATAARKYGWTIDEIPVRDKVSLLAFARNPQRSPKTAGRREDASKTLSKAMPDLRPPQVPVEPPARIRRVYLSTGIHGDEPAGPLAIRDLLQTDALPADMEIRILPCLNPAGFLLNRRENAEGLDLNRQYLEPVAEETRAHIHWILGQEPFDLCLCLHEDWESHGFYVYELNPDNQPSLAEPIVSRVSAVCPIDRSELIEGRPAHDGIIRPSIDPTSRPQWPESFFLLTHKTRLSYTLEAPSDFPLSARVAALIVGVNAALQSLPKTRG